MNERSILTISGGELICKIVRFFKKNEITYLIYSCNEEDDAGYVKLYASKILDNRAKLVDDDEEWLGVKEIIKEVVRNNRDGLSSDIIDLDESMLDNIVLEDNRIFKLQNTLVNLFSENKKVTKPTVESIMDDPIIEDFIEDSVQPDYKDLYEKAAERLLEMDQRIDLLEQEVNTYKDKLNKVLEAIHSE